MDETIIAHVNDIPNEMSFEYEAEEKIITGHDNNFSFASDANWCVVIGDKIKVDSNPSRQSRETSVNVSWKKEMMKVINVKQAGIPIPSNDQCSDAISLSCGTTLNGTTVHATSKTIPNNTASKYGVWYTFTGDDRITTISLSSASNYNPKIVIYSGSCSSMSLIGSSNNGGAGGTDTYTFTTTAETRYYIYISYFSPDANSTFTGTFSISRSCTTPLKTPTNVKATKNGSFITISWNSVSGATSYEVFYWSNANNTYYSLGTTNGTSMTNYYPYTGANYYIVKAINSSTYSNFCDDVYCDFRVVPSIIYSAYNGSNYKACDGIYRTNGSPCFSINLSNLLNRNHFNITFDFWVTEHRNQWIFTLSGGDGILGINLKNSIIYITTSKQDYSYNTNLSYILNTWTSISLDYSYGMIRINNGNWFNVNMNITDGDNVLSSTNSSKRIEFKGYLRNIKVTNYD